MPRDYKNRNSEADKKESNYNPLFPFISGLSIGLTIAVGVYFYFDQYIPPPVIITEYINETPEDTSSTEETGPENPESDMPEPEFTFYNKLPNREIDISWHLAEADESGSDDVTKTRSDIYYIQAGSFRESKSAEEIKAKLALLGIKSEIQKALINGQDIWYRVRIGPYNNFEELRSTRKRLSEHDLEHMIQKLE